MSEESDKHALYIHTLQIVIFILIGAVIGLIAFARDHENRIDTLEKQVEKTP